MIPETFFIRYIGRGMLGIMPRPRGNDWLEDEIRGLKNLGYNMVISFLEKSEEIELELTCEKEICKENGIKFLSYHFADRSIPEESSFIDLISVIHSKIIKGAKAVVHCRGGIGRAGIAASSILILNGATAENAVNEVSEARGFEIPDTKEQRQWIFLNEKKLKNNNSLKIK